MIFHIQMKHRPLILYSVAFVILFLSSWFTYQRGKHPLDLKQIALSAQESVRDLQVEAAVVLDGLSADSSFLADPFSSPSSERLTTFQDRGLFFFTYSQGMIRYWSTNKVPLPSSLPSEDSLSGLHWIGNGWYVAMGRKQSDTYLLALIRVSQEFPFQNEYLVNSFLPSLGIPPNVVLSPDPGLFNVSGLDDHHLFSLEASATDTGNPNSALSVFLALVSFIFLLFLLFQAHRVLNPFVHYPRFHLLAFTADAILVRLLMSVLSFPGFLFNSAFFQPYDFSAGFLLRSPGDLSLDIITMFFIAMALGLGSRKVSDPPVSSGAGSLFNPLLGTLGVIAGFYLSSEITRAIFLHSSVVLNLGQLFSFGRYSFLFLLFITFAYSSSLLLGGTFLNRLILPYIRSSGAWLGIALAIFLTFFISLVSPLDLYPGLILALLILGAGIVSWRYAGNAFSLVAALIAILIVSVFATIQHNNLNREKEHQRRILIADVLSQEQDPVSEYLFREAVGEMDKDEKLHALVNIDSLDDDLLSRYIKFKYFNRDPHWEHYSFQFTTCLDDQELILESDISPDYTSVNCDSFFLGLLTDLGHMTLSPHLFYIDYGTGQDSYLGILRFPRNTADGRRILTVYIEFTSRDVRSDLGFPSLLTDNSSDLSPLGYSYAYYKNGKLLSSYGKFTYNIELSNYGDSIPNLGFFSGRDFHHTYDHLFHRIDDNRVLLLSREKPGMLELISPVSYFFLLFLSVIFLVMLLFIGRKRLFLVSPSFRSRLQLTLISIIIISFVTVGLASLSYIRNLNRQKNFDGLTEKAHSVLIEVEHKLSGVDSLSSDITPYLTKIITKFSRVFFTDINLFDLNGSLLASSRSQIFDEQLISTQMEPEAFHNMYIDKKSLFIQRETIGGLHYLSAYVPFRNEKDELVAYLNLPYFVKEQELKSEITAFLVAFINIYALLIALTIIFALFFSNLVTRPLQLIRDSLRRVRLDSTNARIEMNRSDEIGELVQEYNRMVDELGHSAELLASSERQSAWREMAKQVAHEIKNPLTPMKLSVQHLEKAWREKDPDWELRLQRFTHTIIEQIESLSQIASEFSDFAKMPETRKEKVFLEHILTSSAEIFGNIDHVRLGLHYDPSSTYPVLADKKQLLRAFNNLIKNARQAVEDIKDGQIDISLRTEGSYHIVEVCDNGPGIDPAQADKIFSPNFTTKSGGMGLGLAIVRSIMEESSGSVDFVPAKDGGVIFVVRLPRYDNLKTE